MIGYIALVLSIIAVTMTNMKSYRYVHLTSSILYLFYGLSINAIPIVIGAILFTAIHIRQLIRIIKLENIQKIEDD